MTGVFRRALSACCGGPQCRILDSLCCLELHKIPEQRSCASGAWYHGFTIALFRLGRWPWFALAEQQFSLLLASLLVSEPTYLQLATDQPRHKF